MESLSSGDQVLLTKIIARILSSISQNIIKTKHHYVFHVSQRFQCRYLIDTFLITNAHRKLSASSCKNDRLCCGVRWSLFQLDCKTIRMHIRFLVFTAGGAHCQCSQKFSTVGFDSEISKFFLEKERQR